jgi:hypothetical protein
MKRAYKPEYWSLTPHIFWRLLKHRWVPTRAGVLIRLNPKLLTANEKLSDGEGESASRSRSL